MPSNPATVLSNPYFDLLYHDDEKVIHHIYKPPMDSAHLKELLSAGTDLLRKYGATKWLSDNRQLENEFDAETAAWVNDVWLPDTMAAGWKYWAMVVPQAVAANADHVKFVESFHGSGVWVTVWSNVEEAFEWIMLDDKV